MEVPFRHQKLGYVALNVTDIERSSRFAEDMIGLDPAGEGEGGERYFRCSNDWLDVVLHPSRDAGFKRVGWELEEVDHVERAFHHFDGLGLKPRWLEHDEKEPLGLGLGPAFRVREPHSGGMFEYYALMRQKLAPFSKRVANIQRLGHFALNVPDLRAATDFYVEKMGFRVSDYVGDLQVSLMRAFPNPLHHTMGLGQSRSGESHLNHINFMVTDIDDIGRAMYRFRKHDVKVVFGPGRHPTSGSIFIYCLDPDGMTWEYSFGMELFPEEGARKARFMSAALEDFDVWGAVPTPDFAGFGPVERAESA